VSALAATVYGLARNTLLSLFPIRPGKLRFVALMQFILDHDFYGLISYHSAALGIFPGGSPPDVAAQRLAAALAAVSGYRYPARDYGCEYTGQFADWAVSQGIPAVDVELTTHSDTDFDINVAVLDTFLRWRP